MMQLTPVHTHGRCDARDHRMLPAEVGRDETMVHGQQTDDRLDTSRGTGGMTCEALSARHWRHRVAKEPLKGHALALVVVGRTCAVGIHIVDVGRRQACHRECLVHSLVGPLAVCRRGRLVEGITGIAVAGEKSVYRCLSPTGGCFRFHHHIGRTLTKIQAGTLVVKRSATLLVKNHQRTEAIQVEYREGLRTTCHYNIGLTSLQHLSPKNQGVGSRGTGGRDGSERSEAAKVVGYLPSIVAAGMIV